MGGGIYKPEIITEKVVNDYFTATYTHVPR
jgi:hypothetical protein